jgi:flavin-dependent dehydrogenase
MLLKKEFGLQPDIKHLWRDGCLEPAMVKKPFSGAFPLAQNNVLLVGNPAGLIIPMTGEGIAPAMKSGLLAGEAVIQALKSNRSAETYYLPRAQEMVTQLGKIYPPPGKLREAVNRGMAKYFEIMREIWLKSLDVL